MNILEVDNVTKRFGGVAAVDSVSFQVEDGTVTGLIGPNGAGKTTLFNLLCGLEVPSAGTIRLLGEKINGLRPDQIARRGIGRTFQIPRPLPMMTSQDNVVVAALSHSRTAAAQEEAAALLRRVGLSNKADTPARSLTGIELKRLEVARALATRPRLLLLDEVMAGLNPTEIADAMSMITGLKADGLCVILVEHNVHAVMSVSDKVIVLDHGRRIAEGPPQEVAVDPAVVEAYLGPGSSYGA